jgi:hypothetical protein
MKISKQFELYISHYNDSFVSYNIDVLLSI